MSKPITQKQNNTGDQQFVRVAIVDSGIELSHPDIGEISGGVGISIHEDGHPVYSTDFADSFGHGTACAGIIRKKAYESDIYSVRILDASMIADGRALVAAIQWCIDSKMDVVNLSLGTTDVTFKACLQEVCRKAADAGVILVGAQNNAGTESFPAVFPEVIGVAGGPIRDSGEFYFRRENLIECVARGDEQRVCCLNGSHTVARGNSFAASHISAIVACLLKQHPNCSIQDIRLLLQERASKVIPTGRHTYGAGPEEPRRVSQDDTSWIKKAVLYPYNKRMHNLLRYRHLLSFDIVAVCNGMGKGSMDGDAGDEIDKPGALKCPSGNIRRALAGADTLILGCVEQRNEIHRRDVLREYVQLSLEEGCHLFSFQTIDPTVYGDLYGTADQKGLRLVSPCISEKEKAYAIRNFNELPQVDVPVVCVAGTSADQGKFTMQLALGRKLMREGYRVGQLGTQVHARLFGMDGMFPMGEAFPRNFSIGQLVPYVEYVMREICVSKRPDIILTGSRNGTIPFDLAEHRARCLSSLAFLLGVSPDACVLVVNSIDPLEYIRDTMDGIRAVCKAPTIALAMGNREKHIRTASTTNGSSREIAPAVVSDRLKNLEDMFQLPAVAILSDTDQQRLAETVIQHFSS